MRIPNESEKEKADGKGGEPAHDGKKIFELPRHIQRDDQQGDGKAKDGVAEGLQTRHLPSTQPKPRPARIYTMFVQTHGQSL